MDIISFMVKWLIIFIINLFLIHNIFALDVGNGSLGACTEADFVATDSGPYNCTTLTIGAAFNFTGDAIATTAPVVIKVMGNVIINNTLSVNGDSGGVGNETDTQVDGAIPGRGGFGGGSTGVDANFPGLSGNDGGYGGAGGGGGKGAATNGSGYASGGGAGGGRFGGASSAGNDGELGGGAGAAGDYYGVGGSVGAITYAPESNFKNIFVGGSGGGGGGP